MNLSLLMDFSEEFANFFIMESNQFLYLMEKVQINHHHAFVNIESPVFFKWIIDDISSIKREHRRESLDIFAIVELIDLGISLLDFRWLFVKVPWLALKHN